MSSILDKVPHTLPALTQALEISEAAVAVGFEWDNVADVWTKVEEEILEFKEAAPHTPHKAEEFGDVLFTLVNVARKEGIDPEAALISACDKFRKRWSIMENIAEKDLNKDLEEVPRGKLEELWIEAKKCEK